MAMDNMLMDLEKGPDEIMDAADAQLPAMLAGGEEKELLVSDLGRLLPHMLDLEKGVDQEGMDTPAHEVLAMVEDEEEEHPVIKDLRAHQVEGGAVAGKMNPSQTKWLAYWLLVAASMILLDNHTSAAPEDQLLPPGLAMFAVLLCAICLIFRAVKQMA